MKGIVCQSCGYIAINDVKPDTCPVCKNVTFKEDENAIHEPGDVTNFSESEKKHIPAITISKKGSLHGGSESCVDVNVTVGEIIHPMLAEHHINNIDFYVDTEFVARAELRPDKIYPAADISLKVKSGKLTAIERCNLHGAWIAEVDL